MVHPAEVLKRSGSSLFPSANNVIPSSPREAVAAPAPQAKSPQHKGPKRLSSSEAIQLAILLSEQEAQYGANMYDSLRPEDDAEIQGMMAQGMEMEAAVMAVFERKYVHPQQQRQANQSNLSVRSAGHNSVASVSQLSMGSMYSQAQSYQSQIPNQGQLPPQPAHAYARTNSQQSGRGLHRENSNQSMQVWNLLDRWIISFFYFSISTEPWEC